MLPIRFEKPAWLFVAAVWWVLGLFNPVMAICGFVYLVLAQPRSNVKQLRYWKKQREIWAKGS